MTQQQAQWEGTYAIIKSNIIYINVRTSGSLTHTIWSHSTHILVPATNLQIEKKSI